MRLRSGLARRPRLGCDCGLEGGPLLRGRGLVPDQRAEHLAGVLEDDPGEQLDDLRDRELLEQDLELAAADRGMVHRGGLRERDRERVPRARLLGRRQAQGGAELAAGMERECPPYLLLELRRQRRGRADERMLEAVPGREHLRPMAHDAVRRRIADLGKRESRHGQPVTPSSAFFASTSMPCSRARFSPRIFRLAVSVSCG